MSYDRHLDRLAEAGGTVKKWVGYAVFAIIALMLASSTFFTTDAGYTYVYQNTMTGGMTVYSQPGIHFKVPFFNRIEAYKQVVTISFGADDDTSLYTKSASDPIGVRFADTYAGAIPVTFRLKLPLGEAEMLRLHQDFRTFGNLADALMIRTPKDVVVNTATQYTGEEFFQGGLNQFKAALEDQLQNGIYQTERRQVQIEDTALAPTSLENQDSNTLHKRTTLVWKTVPLAGDDGKPIRLSNPLAQYGIEVTQVTITDPKPDQHLENMLTDKRKLVAQRISAVQRQETAKAEAAAEQLQKEIERTRARQDALRAKEMAEIAKQQEVEVARKQAEKEIVEERKRKDLAEIERQKELAIATANRDIQEANAKAAEFEAKAVREVGMAKADVERAMYKAKGDNSTVFLAEVQRDIAKVMYENLGEFKIQMPNNVVMTGEGGKSLPSNLDVLTAYGALGIMDKMPVPAQK